MNTNRLNQQLRDLYLKSLPSIHDLVKQNASKKQLHGMSGPFMMHVYPEYADAIKKLMFVGREAHTWEKYNLEEDHILTHQRLTNVYKVFTSDSKKPNSPFWWFIRDLSASYGQADYAKTALWTNLSKIDIDGERPTGKVYDYTMQGFLDLLVQEVSIVKPDVLILMTTDPNYQWHMAEKFGLAIGASKREPLIPNQLFRWVSDILPINTFQICHPNRLRFMVGGYKQNAEQIIQAIKQQV